ncbi:MULTISPECIES: DMT family transporter [unclassified Eubacterium (in: firmicutes)]|jgi:transporter family-2 protein|uniref:DMT family transporter n=1 Tax=Eubacterium TaxID=1730 RepID=UPI000E54A788|nr:MULTISPECIES: DMT family transporter [unclassified Eubacterium (in: firmicutes)]RGF52438.1 DMT family transporter [Eubacterium sp. AF36-5BH]RHP22217.1 DMT family transporter [Eubacterium sp. AF34-35BH]
MWGFIIALISGALMSIQGVFNTGITKSSSMWAANSWVQLTAFLVCVIAWFVTGKQNVMGMFHVENKYMLLGGVIGAFITMTVIKGMNSLGPAKAVLIIVISQIIVAYLIELFGLFGVDKVPFQWSKLVGALVAIVGIFIFHR